MHMYMYLARDGFRSTYVAIYAKTIFLLANSELELSRVELSAVIYAVYFAVSGMADDTKPRTKQI